VFVTMCDVHELFCVSDEKKIAECVLTILLQLLFTYSNFFPFVDSCFLYVN